MSMQRSFFVISVLLIAFLNSTTLFGMLSIFRDKRLARLNKLIAHKKLIVPALSDHNNKIELKYTFNVDDRISILLKEICYEIFAQLDPGDKNNMQQTSKHWNVIGSKRVPNVYNLALSKSFNVALRDFIFIRFCAINDKKDDVLKNLNMIRPCIGTIDDNHRLFWWLSNINYPTGQEVNRSFNLSALYCYHRPLEMACYGGDSNKIKELLVGYNNKNYCIDHELVSSFAIAVKKNDFDCLNVLSSMLKDNSIPYSNIIGTYVLIMEIALRTNNQKAFEFLSCNFYAKPVVDYFLLPFNHYSELKQALLSNNEKDVCDVLSSLGVDADEYKNKESYCNVVSYLTSTSNHRADSVSHIVYFSLIVDYFNKKRKEKKWNSSADIFTNQDKDLSVAIKAPLLDALNNNNLDSLKMLIQQVEESQFFYDKKQRSAKQNSLFSIHIDLLKKARQLNNKEAFFLLSCLRLTVDFSDFRNDFLMSLYRNYSDQVDYQKQLMAKQQSSSIVDNAYAYIAGLF
jgi:hypothetical protein